MQLRYRQCTEVPCLKCTQEWVYLDFIAFSGAIMASPASIKKHPIHPMLVGVPIGLWVFALVCDVMRAATGSSVWQTVAIYCIAGGIVGAIRRRRARPD